MNKKDYNPILQKTFLEIVENQIRDNDPPETPMTFERLKGLGFGDRSAKLLVGSVIATETFFIMKYGEQFNHERFVRNLDRLPDQSFDEQ